MKLRPPLIGIAAMVALICPATAAEIEGVRFPEHYETGDVSFELTCVGLMRYRIFIKAYVGAFYLGAGVPAQSALEDVPKRLVLHYFWSIDGRDFAKAGDQVLADNVDAATMARLRPRLDQINALYEDVKPGDRYALTYIPGSGTELALNGERKGVVPGADFAAAYFRIWLGARPIDAGFRDRLLRCERAAAGGPAPAGANADTAADIEPSQVP